MVGAAFVCRPAAWRATPYASPHLHLISPRNKRILMGAVGFRKESRTPPLYS
jgi:hypothetical protein